MSKDESLSDDSSNQSDDCSLDENNDNPFYSIDKDDMAISNRVTSLGINLELVLEISQEDMLIDEASTPLDE